MAYRIVQWGTGLVGGASARRVITHPDYELVGCFAHTESKGMPQTQWIMARKGARLLAIGDESRVLTTALSAEERAKLCLSDEEKAKKLAALLEAL